MIYDGRKTVNVFIDDVRIGDIVEYAYTLHGANPAFGGQRFGRFEMQWQVPVHRFSYRLLWPQGRPIQIEHVRTKLRPRERDLDGFHEYRWQADRLEPLVVEADAPAWFDPYPAVEFTEFKDWAAVARWAVPMYETPATLGPALQAEVRRISQEADTPEERLLGVLRFVQKDIRYLGVEVGAGSYRPSAPDTVLQRRFGDCKDKTLLTMTMARALGIEAHAALVNTRVGRGIQDLMPMPGAFNHVIVLARVNGRDYWLDPTRAPQNSALDKIHQPDFEQALVVRIDTRALRNMAPVPRLNKRRVNVTIDARDGKDNPAQYTIITVVEGNEAEGLRYRLSSENRDETEKRYVNYYARYYPGVKTASPITVDDDVQANRITTTERYLIPEFWKHSEEKQRLQASIEVPDLNDALPYPRNTVRNSPLYLMPPLELVHTTEVRLPDEWTIKPETLNVKDPAFEFQRDVALDGRTLVFTDRFQSRMDHIAADETSRYAANMERARQHLNYVLYQGTDPSSATTSPASGMSAINWPIALLAVVVTGLWTWLAVKIYRHDPPRPARAVFSTEPSIGGWLILAALSVIGTPLRLLYQVLHTNLQAYGLPGWTALTTPGSTHYHALWAPVLLTELVGTLGMLVMSLLLATMFFQKRFTFPHLFIKFQLAAICYVMLDAVLVEMIPVTAQAQNSKELAEFSRGVIVSVIWVLYFWRSQRVKDTFVRGLSQKQDAAVPRAEPDGMEPV